MKVTKWMPLLVVLVVLIQFLLWRQWDFSVQKNILSMRNFVKAISRTKRDLKNSCSENIQSPPDFPHLMTVLKKTYLTTNAKINTGESCLWLRRLHSYLSAIIEPGHYNTSMLDKFIPPKNPSKVMHLEYDGSYLKDVRSERDMQLYTFGERSDDVLRYNIIEERFRWLGAPSLCNAIKAANSSNVGFPKGTQGKSENNPIKRFYNQDCSSDLSEIFPARKGDLSKVQFSHHPDDINYANLDGRPIVPTYLVKVYNALVMSKGQVVTGDVKLHPRSCKIDRSTNVPKLTIKYDPPHKHVFVLSQFYSDKFYHAIIEDLSRLGPYIPLLRHRTDMNVHIYNSSFARNILSLLDISPSRIIKGMKYANIAYIPEGTACGAPRPINIQLFYKAIQVSIAQKYPSFMRNRYIVLIKRSPKPTKETSRLLKEHARVAKVLKGIADDFNLEFIVYDDNPLPSFATGLRIFHEAAMIVAPHGAGLTNTVFARPGTLIVEAVCAVPNLNLCYQMLTNMIGLRYYGIPGQTIHHPFGGGSCETVDPDVNKIDKIIRQYLENMSYVS